MTIQLSKLRRAALATAGNSRKGGKFQVKWPS
jgi:hypothetical protein